MAEFILNDQALTLAEDLTTASSTAKYGLGQVFQTIDQDKNVRTYKYVKAGGAITAKSALIILPSQVTSAPATSSIAVEIGVANIAASANQYLFIQIGGLTTITSAGATTEGNTGKLTNGATTVTDEGADDETAKTIGVITNTLAAAGDAEVFLVNKRVTI